MLDRLEEIGSYYNAANLAAGNLRVLWQKKGNYWDATEEAFDGTLEAGGGGIKLREMKNMLGGYRNNRAAVVWVRRQSGVDQLVSVKMSGLFIWLSFCL